MNERWGIERAVRVAIYGALLALAFLFGSQQAISATIPPCDEDEVLVGDGGFDGTRYERYICGPAVDDFR